MSRYFPGAVILKERDVQKIRQNNQIADFERVNNLSGATWWQSLNGDEKRYIMRIGVKDAIEKGILEKDNIKEHQERTEGWQVPKTSGSDSFE